MNTPLTQEEKIDYIYNHMKKQNRNAIFKIIFKIIFILIVALSVFNLYKTISSDNLQETMQDWFADFTYPIIENLLDKTNKDLQEQYQQQY